MFLIALCWSPMIGQKRLEETPHLSRAECFLEGWCHVAPVGVSSGTLQRIPDFSFFKVGTSPNAATTVNAQKIFKIDSFYMEKLVPFKRWPKAFDPAFSAFRGWLCSDSTSGKSKNPFWDDCTKQSFASLNLYKILQTGSWSPMFRLQQSSCIASALTRTTLRHSSKLNIPEKQMALYLRTATSTHIRRSLLAYRSIWSNFSLHSQFFFDAIHEHFQV